MLMIWDTAINSLDMCNRLTFADVRLIPLVEIGAAQPIVQNVTPQVQLLSVVLSLTKQHYIH